MTWVRRASDYAFFDTGGRPLAFAHRGGSLAAPNVGIENSLAAFEYAVGLGFRYLETDVHATADGVCVAFHDDRLDRVTDRAGPIGALPYAEVGAARIGGREPIPRLADVLAAWPDVRVNIDCKSAAAIRPLCRVVREQRAWDRVCLASFSPRRLHRIRAELGDRVATSCSVAGAATLRLLPGSLPRRALLGRGAVAAQLPESSGRLRVVTPALVARAHDLGWQLHVWTVDDAPDMGRLLDLGVDGIITDRPDVLRDVCIARGEWAA